MLHDLGINRHHWAVMERDSSCVPEAVIASEEQSVPAVGSNHI